jgi:signal transduction histidine kinase
MERTSIRYSVRHNSCLLPDELFLLLCAAGTGLLIWTIYKLRVHQVAMRLDSQFEARLAERTRIAQELHDTLLQGVLSASMQLKRCE